MNLKEGELFRHENSLGQGQRFFYKGKRVPFNIFVKLWNQFAGEHRSLIKPGQVPFRLPSS